MKCYRAFVEGRLRGALLGGPWAAGRFGAHFRFGTLMVNIRGSLLLGFVVVLATERLVMSPETRLLLTVGFVRSFTTLSSYPISIPEPALSCL